MFCNQINHTHTDQPTFKTKKHQRMYTSIIGHRRNAEGQGFLLFQCLLLFDVPVRCDSCATLKFLFNCILSYGPWPMNRCLIN